MTLTNIGINSTWTEILDYLPDFNLSNGELFAPRVWSFFLIDIKKYKDKQDNIYQDRVEVISISWL